MIFPRIGLSHRRHLPVFYVEGRNASLLHMPSYLYATRAWSLLNRYEGEGGQVAVLKHHETTLHIGTGYVGILLLEWRLWSRAYAIFDLKGRTVLDVGAGCGETAYFFLLRGAKRIMCIEPQARYCELLRKNIEINSWPVEVYQDVFRTKHLDFDYDFAKIDCEGGESCLLSYDRPLKPTVMEVHGKELMEKIKEHFPEFRELARIGSQTRIMTNIRG